MRSWLWFVVLAGCGDVKDVVDGGPTPGDGSATHDGAADEALPRCNPTSPFQTPVQVTSLNTGVQDFLWLRDDELSGYLSRAEQGSRLDLFEVTRTALTDSFTLTPLTSVNTAFGESRPSVSSDGLTLFAASEGSGYYKIAISTRASTTAAFGALATATAINHSTASTYDAEPYVLPNGETYFTSDRPGGVGGVDLYQSMWNGTGFTTPAVLREVSSAFTDSSATVTQDNKTLFFTSDRGSTTAPNFDIYVSTRSSVGTVWGAPILVGELASAVSERPLWVSADGCVLYLNRENDILVAQRGP